MKKMLYTKLRYNFQDVINYLYLFNLNHNHTLHIGHYNNYLHMMVNMFYLVLNMSYKYNEIKFP